jgi:hypothetical protein
VGSAGAEVEAEANTGDTERDPQMDKDLKGLLHQAEEAQMIESPTSTKRSPSVIMTVQTLLAPH